MAERYLDWLSDHIDAALPFIVLWASLILVVLLLGAAVVAASAAFG